MIYATAFALMALVCSVMAFARHPVWGLFFYMATIYVHPPSRYWGASLPDLRWALLSAVITALAILVHKRRERGERVLWLASPPAVMLSMYAAWMWIQSPWVLNLPLHLDGTVRFTKYLVAFWFVYRIADSRENLMRVLLMHVAGCGLLGIYAMFTGRSGDRLDGVGGPGIDDANTLGMYLATGALLAVALVMSDKGPRRWAALLLLPLIGEGFVLANSRGAFLGLVAGGMVLMFCRAREHRRTLYAFIFAALAGFAVIVDQAFIERMFTIGDVAERDNEEADMSARSRVIIMEAQLKMAADYPAGAGYRGTAVLSTRYIDRMWLTLDKGSNDESTAARSSHNTTLTTLVEQGLPGLLIYLSLLAWIGATILRIRRLNAQGMDPQTTTMAGVLCGVILCVYVSGQATDYLMAEVQFWIYAALVCCLEIGVRDLRARQAALGGAALPAGAAPVPGTGGGPALR